MNIIGKLQWGSSIAQRSGSFLASQCLPGPNPDSILIAYFNSNNKAIDLIQEYFKESIFHIRYTFIVMTLAC